MSSSAGAVVGAIAATAIGAVAIGALAIGALAVRQLTVRRARTRVLVVDKLVINRLIVRNVQRPFRDNESMPRTANGTDAAAASETRGIGDEICRDCGGAGVIDTQRCANCDGTGHITKAIGGG